MSQNARSEFLIDKLSSPDPNERIRVAMLIGSEKDSAAVPEIIAHLGLEEDFQVRETLTWAILQMGSIAHEGIVASLDSEHWPTRYQALHVISKIASPEFSSHVVSMLDDPVDEVSEHAAFAAGQLENPDSTPALLRQLGRGSSKYRNTVSGSLIALNEPLVTEGLISALTDPETQNRVHAADTLALMGPPNAYAAESALIDALGDDNEGVQLAVLNALGYLESEATTMILREQLNSPSPRVQELASRWLERRLPPTDTSLLSILKWLRSVSGLGLSECRKALDEHGGNHLLARDALCAR